MLGSAAFPFHYPSNAIKYNSVGPCGYSVYNIITLIFFVENIYLPHSTYASKAISKNIDEVDKRAAYVIGLLLF